MERDPALVIILLACLLVGAILLVGIGGFARGGEWNKRNANKIMRLRIAAQAVAVLVILVLVGSR